MKKNKIICISVFAGLIITLVFSIGAFAKTCENIRSDVLRLHVLANSDSKEDQDLKLQVRDAVLSKGSDLFAGSMNVTNAEKKIAENKDKLIREAERVVRENGFDYDVDVFVTDEYFSTRSYGDVTLPAGKYTAVKVTVGEAQGHNWWCIMFPPMCLPAAEDENEIDLYLDEDEVRLVKSNPEYDVRFKVVEWYESLKDKLFSQS